VLIKNIKTESELSLKKGIYYLTNKYLFLALAFIAIFFLGSFFAIKEYRNGSLSNYVLHARGIVSNNVAIIPNFILGLTAKPDVIYIDMKSREIQRLAYLREKAIGEGSYVIPEHIKEQTVRGEIRYKNQKHKAKFSLTGANLDHISNTYKWSLRVNLNGEEQIEGMEKFTLLVPQTRGSNLLSEWIIHKFSNFIGLINLRYNFKKIILNGKDHGIYAMEEHFDKRMLENNKMRAGLIIKPHLDSFKVYKKKLLENEDSVFDDQSISMQLKYLDSAWQSFLSGKIETSDLFDIEKLSKYYALADLANGQHTHFLGNEFYYFNAFTKLLEPIGREWDAPYSSSENFDIFLNNYSLNDTDPKAKIFQNLIFRDPKFVVLYLDFLEEISHKEFIKNFLHKIKDDIQESKAILFSEYPHLTADENFLFHQVDKIKEQLGKNVLDLIQIQRIGKIANETIFSVTNKSPVPIAIQSILIDKENYPVNLLISRNSNKYIRLSSDIDIINENMFAEIHVGGQKSELLKKILPWTNIDISKIYSSNKKIEDIEAHSEWIIDSNVIIPKNQVLNIGPGTVIDMINGAGIISYGGVSFNGTNNDPIHIISRDGTGIGLAVISASKRSNIDYTNFKGLSEPEKNARFLTSPVVFYESDVDITNSSFENNSSEDALNIVRSDFFINKVLFRNTPSDALDADYSTGHIKEASFFNIGNDSIDVSGANVLLENISINGSLDKGISIGEKSVATGSDIYIKDSNLGISSKDLSSFRFNKVEISNTGIAYSLFIKKREFGPSSGIIIDGTLKENDLDFLIEKGSSLKFNDIPMLGDLENVKSLIYDEVDETDPVSN